MSNSGYEDVRGRIAESLNRRFGTSFSTGNILMTVGAAGGMNAFFKAFINPGDEIITFAPYFGEYRAYASNVEANLVVIPPNTEDFQPDIEALREAITPKTKAVIINTPNNPTGVIYSEATLKRIAEVLECKQKEFNTVIAVFSDEPYRELAYDGIEVPYVTKYYNNTVVGYSYSKSLSLPGERIGYLVIPDEFDDAENVISACNVAIRILGFVNAPSLMQRVIGRCVDIDVSENVAVYNRNREALYNGLTEIGFECVKPEGAFYMFVKTPVDDKEFAERAKKYNILVVPGSSFGCPGYVRIAYCVAYETIINSMPQFRKLAEEIGGK
jgi:aspartate aminotransferase